MTGAGDAEATLVLLAGGRGSRMGRRKDGVMVGGNGLVAWMLGRIGWRGPTMLVGPADAAKVVGEDLVDVVVRDAVMGEGPLRGIVTAMERCVTREAVVVPIDMPGLTGREIAWVLKRARERSEAIGVMLRRNTVAGVEIEPFPLVARVGLRAIAERRLGEKKGSVRGLAEENGVVVCEAPGEWEARVWANLNREEDVEAFARGLE